MKLHSIFSRHWWAVCSRAPGSIKSGSARARSEQIASEIAGAIKGTLHKSANLHRYGAFITSIKEENQEEVRRISGALSISVELVIQTDKRYFPIGLQDIETGPFTSEEINSGERDFPRQLTNSIIQYPLLIGISEVNPTICVFVLSSPYFLLLRDIMNGFKTTKHFSSFISLDVEKAFKKLKDVVLPHGELFVKSGRMVITGIDFIRAAEFSGDNVIASSLYSDLCEKPQVNVHPKACRLGRQYEKPVGGNCRPFVCWFDQHGNFRFTPGINTASSIHKFIELLSILNEKNLLEEAETLNPLTKYG